MAQSFEASKLNMYTLELETIVKKEVHILTRNC